MISVVLSFKFLSPFYLKQNADFRIILYTLKTLAFEADVNFSSIHEIRSLESNGGELDDRYYLRIYRGKYPAFYCKLRSLRRYPSDICLRPRLAVL